MLKRIWQYKLNIFAILVVWVVFECWISWSAFCGPSSDKYQYYKTTEEYCSAFKGPLISTISFAFVWFGGVLDDHSHAVTAFATIAIAFFTWTLWQSSEKMWDVTKIAAEAAQKSAQVSERTLKAVESPVLDVYLPDKIPLIAGKPKFSVHIKNIGKQIGLLKVTSAAYFVQDDPKPPPLTPRYETDGTNCPIFLVGEYPVRLAEEIVIPCERQEPLTATEINGIIDWIKFGFFRFGAIYSDPIGFYRSSVWIFHVTPTDHGGVLSQVISVSEVLEEKTLKEHKQLERQLVGDLIKSRAEIERARRKT